MRRLFWSVACCIVSVSLVAGEPTGYLGSLDTNPVVPTTLVVNTSNNKIYVGGTAGASVKVKVLNASNGQQSEITIPVITAIRGMAYDPVSNQIFVISTSSQVGVIDCDTDTARATNIDLGSGLANNANAAGIDPLNRKLYIATTDAANDIVIVDIATEGAETVDLINASATLSTVAVDPLGDHAFMGSLPGGAGNRVIETTGNSTFITFATGGGENEDALCLAMAGPNLFAATNAGRIYYNGPMTGGQVIVGGTDATTGPSGDDLTSIAYNPVLDRIYVGNLTKGRVYVITGASTATPAFNAMTGTLNISQPKSIAVNPNTARVYVTSTLTTLVTVDGTDNSIVTLDTSASSVNTVAINTVTNRVFVPESSSPKINVYDGAVNKVTSKDGSGAVAAYNFSSALIATNSTSGAVYTVDVGMGMQSTSTVRQIVGSTVTSGTGGAMPVDIGINEISNKIYIANQGDNTVTRFDGASFGTAPKAIALNAGGLTGLSPVAIAVDSTVNRIFVANKGAGMGQSGNISVIYGGPDEVIATLPLDGEPTAICVLPGRAKLYVATKQNDQGFVTVFSTLENKLIKKLSVQESPQQLLAAGGDRIYVSSLTSAAVQAIDAQGDNVIGSITCGNSNNIMAYNRTNGMLYVVSRSSAGNLTAIDVQTNSTRQAPTSAGSSPVSIVASPSGNRVYIGQQSGTITVLDGGVNAFFLTQVNSFNTQGLLNALSIDTLRSKLYVAGIGFRSVDLESGMFDPAFATLTHPAPALYFNNNPQFTLAAGMGGTAVYYQLNSTQGTWTRAPAGALTLPTVSAGNHILYAFATRDQDATTAAFPQGTNTPTIGKIDACAFTVHDAALPLPTLNGIEDQIINEDQGQVSIDFFGVTPGPIATAFSAANISIVTSNSNPAGLVTIVSPVDFDSARGKGTLRITPASNLFGDVLITVVVTDPSVIAGVPSAQLTVTRTFRLTVRPVNDAPTFTVGSNITVSEAANVANIPSFISAVVFGPANEVSQTVSEYIVTATVPDQFKVQPAINASNGTLTFTPANNTSQALPITINVQLKDNGGTSNGGVDTSAIQSFTITLNPIADTLVVTNTGDSSVANSNSLRDCMNRARSGDTITFDANIFDLTNSNAATVINVSGPPLPTLNDGNVTIEASDRRVTVNGTSTVDANGILIMSNSNTIRGLNIVGFPGAGIRIQGGASNIIGGARTTGTGPNGQGLRISDNGSFGVDIRGAAATGNVVKGCWIGLDSAGTSAESNLAGILIQDGAAGNIIGGTATGEANVISGNKFEGTTFSGTGTDNNTFTGNQVGIGAVSEATSRSAGNREDDVFVSRSAAGNGSAGLFLSRGTNGSKVGGDNDSEGNVVANNGGNGVEVRAAGSRRNAAKKNRISRNKSGGIALFDNANDGITAPTFAAVTRNSTGSLSRGTVSVTVTGTSTSTSGNVELFSDTGSQGENFISRAAVTNGTWMATIDVSDVLNLTATVTDDNGNTSPFAVFGRVADGDSTNVDTDGDGITDELESLAGTDANDATSTPTDGGALIVDKLQISMNFAKTNADSLKATVRLVLPTGYVTTDSVFAVRFADSTQSVTLTSKGSAPKGTVALKLAGGSTTAAAANTGGKFTYAISKSSLLSGLQSAGLDNETTDKAGESLSVPVGVAITSGGTTSVYSGTVLVIYKATTGKTGKAKQSL